MNMNNRNIYYRDYVKINDVEEKFIHYSGWIDNSYHEFDSKAALKENDKIEYEGNCYIVEKVIEHLPHTKKARHYYEIRCKYV